MSAPKSTPIPSEPADTALARGRLYAFLAQAFSYPDRAWRETLLARGAETLAALNAAPIVPPLSAALAALQEASEEEILDKHVALFGHASGRAFPLYEIEYGPKSEVAGPNRLADVASFYAAFGLEIARAGTASPERIDHLSVEFEFLHYLCVREAHALLNRHGPQALSLLREAQRKFLAEHLGRFAPVLAKKLIRSDVAGVGVYGPLAALADQWVLSECDRLGVDPREGILPLAPRLPPTDEDLCVSCALSQSCPSGEGWEGGEGGEGGGGTA